MDAHFSSITGPITTVRTSRRIQGTVLDAMGLHVLLGHALDAAQIRALHVALGTVEALVESPSGFRTHSDAAPHAGPRTDVLLVVLPLLKRYFQPAAQSTTDGSP